MDFAHQIGDTVFLKTDSEQLARLVTGIVIRPTTTLFILACGSNESTHYPMEFSTERANLLTGTSKAGFK